MDMNKDLDSSRNGTNAMDLNVAEELVKDMYFVTELIQIQEYIENEWLRDYYCKIAISYLSVILHECFQANLINKEKFSKDVIKILSSIRQRMIKLVPNGDSESMKRIMDTMEVDFDHYCFDIQIILNELNKKELFGINFTYYDYLKEKKEKDIFDDLIKFPFEVITYLKTNMGIENKKRYSDIGNSISKKVVLRSYPYASGVFLGRPEICREDKIVVLYYYILVKQAIALDFLVPKNLYPDEYEIDTMSAKCKFRAIIIENIGLYLKKANSSLAEEMRVAINDAMDVAFYKVNRSVKNNIHYKKTTVYSKAEIEKLYFQQGMYLKIVKKIFDSKIKYKIGFIYKIIRYVADKTDATMIEIRKENADVKKAEDVSRDEWDSARERIRKRTGDE